MPTKATTESVYEIPWGPGMATLKQPLELSVEENTKTGFTSIYCEVFGISGQGKSFEDALLDFSTALEDEYENCKRAPLHISDPTLEAMLEEFEAYIPEKEE